MTQENEGWGEVDDFYNTQLVSSAKFIVFLYQDTSEGITTVTDSS